MSEHTAEFVLVPNLVEQLGNRYPEITPFFYWATREGAHLRRSFPSRRVRVVAAYARRPKIGGGAGVAMKVNALLVHHASVLSRVGVPLLAGLPLVEQLCDLRMHTPCCWFQVRPGEQEPSDFEIRVSGSGQEYHADLPMSAPLRGPLSSSDLQDLVGIEARLLMPFDAVRIITEECPLSRASEWSRIHHRFGQLLPYKPFYLLIFD